MTTTQETLARLAQTILSLVIDAKTIDTYSDAQEFADLTERLAKWARARAAILSDRQRNTTTEQVREWRLRHALQAASEGGAKESIFFDDAQNESYVVRQYRDGIVVCDCNPLSAHKPTDTDVCRHIRSFLESQ